MEYTRRDLILLDDDLEIMVVPHLGRKQKWLTYDEVDEMRWIFQGFPRMLQTYNELCAWVKIKQMGLDKEMISEESNGTDL
jgi:hypothetical protein